MYQIVPNYKANTSIFEYLNSCTGFLENINIKGDSNMPPINKSEKIEFPYLNLRFICEDKYSVDSIKRIINNNPYTVILWKDGTKTIVKCQEGDTYNFETGIAMCFMKKMCGNNGSFNEVFRKYCENNN